MALIKCPACQNEVSDQAISCPKCGQPLKVDPVQTVQLTNKKWKKYSLVAVALLFIGICMAFSGSPGYAGLGSLLIAVSLVLVVISRIGAWWTNG